MILRDSRVVAAACIFPVSQRESLDRSFGLRHRAGLGLSEETDALALVVSEETGSVSLCNGRSIRRGLTRPELRRLLGQALFLRGKDDGPTPTVPRPRPRRKPAMARRRLSVVPTHDQTLALSSDALVAREAPDPCTGHVALAFHPAQH